MESNIDARTRLQAQIAYLSGRILHARRVINNSIDDPIVYAVYAPFLVEETVRLVRDCRRLQSYEFALARLTLDPKPERVAAAFNEWMRRFTEEPDRFSREWQAVSEFLKEREAGQEPSYGREAAAYLEQLIAEQA